MRNCTGKSSKSPATDRYFVRSKRRDCQKSSALHVFATIAHADLAENDVVTVYRAELCGDSAATWSKKGTIAWGLFAPPPIQGTFSERIIATRCYGQTHHGAMRDSTHSGER